MRPVLAFLAGATVVVVLTAAAATRPGASQGDPLPDPADIAAEIATLAATAPPSQQPALADRFVDDAEYHRAVEQRLACVVASRPEVEVVGPRPTAQGFLRWRYRLLGGPDPTITQVDRRCAASQSNAVERAYRLGRIPLGAARRAAANDLKRCLVASGVVASGDGVNDVLAAAGSAPVPVAHCLDRHENLVGLQGRYADLRWRRRSVPHCTSRGV
jgi:hypothetical protein